MTKQIVIIGGGAAGFFAAITCAEQNRDVQITILEKSTTVLQKVKVSGGGRCNVTHACFDPQELITFYPRGGKELLGPFHQFMTGDTMQWFEERGVPLKIEEDNRVFPVSNSSQSIVDVLINSATKNNIVIKTSHRVESIEKIENQWKVTTSNGVFLADKLLVATGSNTHVWKLINQSRHTIIEPVPSLFTFNCDDNRIKEIPGVSVPHVTIKITGTNLETNGPLLITHWGISGPAILKLSAFGARLLAEKQYQFSIEINWLSKSYESVFNQLSSFKKSLAKKQLLPNSPFEAIPKRLSEKLINYASISGNKNWADLSKSDLEQLANLLTQSIFEINGKSTFKEEFVTAGGIDLKEVNFKRFESKLHKNLFFAGEVLDIDAVTGGFNFQNAWTGGYIAGKAMVQ
ncbi:MAG: NAD(P)/FAD-dependent oxidoreductase [Flavobacteriaceae bacterium]|nr:NAD(P)/FAD-dependent oxidoreductase [Flavobacteriaceae bacterium]